MPPVFEGRPSEDGQQLRDKAIDLMTIWCLKVYVEEQQSKNAEAICHVVRMTGKLPT